eukprot:snap_masked-scaffold_19-processed-gene-3.22-mRNA-1 protein AED:1.00 eAED:1.00 QI:0/-1/0/0/-1/1/1/0/237
MYSSYAKQKTLLVIGILLFIFNFIFLSSSWVAAKDLDINNCVTTSEENDSTNLLNLGSSGQNYQRRTTIIDNEATKVHVFSVAWLFLAFLVIFSSFLLTSKQGFTRTKLGIFAGVNIVFSNWFLILAVDSGHILVDKRYNEDSMYTRAYVEAKAIAAVMLCVLFAVNAVLLLSWEDDLVVTTLQERLLLRNLQEQEEDDIWTKNSTTIQINRTVARPSVSSGASSSTHPAGDQICES